MGKTKYDCAEEEGETDSCVDHHVGTEEWTWDLCGWDQDREKQCGRRGPSWYIYREERERENWAWIVSCFEFFVVG